MLKRFFLKGTKTEQDNGQDEDNFHAFFLLLLLSSPGGFFIHDTLSQQENANGELLLTRVFVQVAFRKTKNKREHNRFQLNFSSYFLGNDNA